MSVVTVRASLPLWSFPPGLLMVPRGVPVGAAALAVVVMLALSSVVRAARSCAKRARRGGRRVVVPGAGGSGRRLKRDLVADPPGGIIPVFCLDESRSTARLRIKVAWGRGTRQLPRAVVGKHDTYLLILAMPNVDAALLHELAAWGDDAGMEGLSVLPMKQVPGGGPTAQDLRDLDVADRLGRQPIELDARQIAHQVSGLSVLGTDSGGSIGSELRRQIVSFGHSKLYLRDGEDSAVRAIQMSLSDSGLLDADEAMLAGISTPEALSALLKATRPGVVSLAAALKHLDMPMVGPCLLLLHFLEQYTSHQTQLDPVKPGSTRLAQVSGCNELLWDEPLRLDMLYLDNQYSPLDIFVQRRMLDTVGGRRGTPADRGATMPKLVFCHTDAISPIL